jgi:ubiquinone/menaquinone biosynthesis C-methylase UbiE
VVRVDLALAEAYRVLKPGGRFLCLGGIEQLWIKYLVQNTLSLPESLS